MPSLILIRHGQGLDPLQGEYDGLSERGLQSLRLGLAQHDAQARRAQAGHQQVAHQRLPLQDRNSQG